MAAASAQRRQLSSAGPTDDPVEDDLCAVGIQDSTQVISRAVGGSSDDQHDVACASFR